MGTPAGWYPELGGRGNVRWWDGTHWTEHVHSPIPGGFERTRTETVSLVVGLIVLVGIVQLAALLLFVNFGGG